MAVGASFGHWAYGSRDETVDGAVVHGEERRKAGLEPNAIFRVDPVFGEVCLTDPIAGGASFYDTRVKLTIEARPSASRAGLPAAGPAGGRGPAPGLPRDGPPAF